MTDSWRITTILDNRSQKSLPSAGNGTGATVVRSERSLEEPVLFARGETQRILNVLGEPTKNNPELLEAIEYNKSYPIWIASPSTEGLHSVLLVGEGDEGDGESVDPVPSFTTVVDGFVGDKPVQDLASTPFKIILQGDFSDEENFATFMGETNKWDTDYIEESMKFFINGEEIQGIVNDGDQFTGDAIDSREVSLYDSSLGEVYIVFDLSEIQIEETDIVSVEYNVNLSDYYFMLTSKGAGNPYLRAKVTLEDKTSKTFNLHFQNKNSFGKYNLNNDSPIEFSLTAGHTNGFGQNIDANEVFKYNDFFVIHYEGGATTKYSLVEGIENFVDGASFVEMLGGYRDIEDLDAVKGLEPFKQFRTYRADIFFDGTGNENIPSAFKELRDNYQKYSRFLLPIKNLKENEAVEETLGVSDRGFGYFWGWFEVINPYSKRGNVISNLIGEVAKNYADSWTMAFGGLAVAWINENGVGGQLTGGRVVRSIYDPSEEYLEQFDNARINPIIFDPSFGPMVVSRRTSVGELSDYSFSDYSMIVDYILKNIVSQVLPYQLIKMNDTIHRNIVRTKTEAILQPMIVAPLNVLDSYFVKCDSENNNDIVKSREEFRLDVAIKVTPKSRTLVLTFINTPQTATVEAMFE